MPLVTVQSILNKMEDHIIKRLRRITTTVTMATIRITMANKIIMMSSEKKKIMNGKEQF